MNERVLQAGVMPVTAAILTSAVISNVAKDGLGESDKRPEERVIEVYQEISEMLWKLRPYYY